MRFFRFHNRFYHSNPHKMSVQILKEMFLKSVEAVHPENLISSQIKVNNGHLLVRDKSYPLRYPCYVVGFGKAVLGMAKQLEVILGNKLERAIVSVPRGIFKNFPFQTQSQKIEFFEGAENNIPDENAWRGAQEIKNLVEKLNENDLLIVLISGGGSALLPLPIPPISLREKQDLIKDLSTKGADIVELNCVRKQISLLKGGGLAKLAYPATVISLILSDIVGDPLDFIASGPTTPNTDNVEDALRVIKKHGSYNTLPQSIKSVLTNNSSSKTNVEFPHVTNYIIGNNKIAAEAALQHALSLGFQSAIISTSITGDVKEISQIYADLARHIIDGILNPLKKLNAAEIARTMNFDVADLINFDFRKNICLIAAGEPTVVVKGSGKGGRNQQLALELSLKLNKLNIKSADISFLSAGTDGIDGPTDAAGAIGTLDLVNNSLEENIKPEDYLNNNDAYAFYNIYRKGSHLIKIGHTGTNVMDLHILLIKPLNYPTISAL